MLEAGNPVAPDKRGTMKAQKLRWIQPALQLADCLMEQERARADMQAHIVALGFNQIDVPGGDADDLRPMRYPEFMNPGRRYGRWGLRRLNLLADAGNSPLQPLGFHRLQ